MSAMGGSNIVIVPLQLGVVWVCPGVGVVLC